MKVAEKSTRGSPAFSRTSETGRKNDTANRPWRGEFPGIMIRALTYTITVIELIRNPKNNLAPKRGAGVKSRKGFCRYTWK
jgi:hypothetical protein